MDPNTKLILEEINKKFAEQDAKWEQRLVALDAGREERIAALESSAEDFAAWRPQVEHVAGALEKWKPGIEESIVHTEADLVDIRLEMQRLVRRSERAVLERTVPDPPNFNHPWSASARAFGGQLHADGPHGHREPGFGSYAMPNPRSTRGTYDSLHTACHPHSSCTQSGGGDRFPGNSGRLPKLNFPQFDGENPKLWITRSENYFDMYGVEQSMWIRVASMHFEGVAARWLQSVQRELRFANLTQFCRLLLDRFGKDQHELLIRQFYHIEQTSSVSNYVQKFTELFDQLSAYEKDTDPLHYTTRFIDGLREDIKAVVMVQRPTNLDEACSLALLQEEAAGSGYRKDFRKSSTGLFSRHASGSGSMPISGQLSKVDKPMVDDQRRGDVLKRSAEQDKMAALRAYRRARGLCDKCAEKWSRDHKCAPTVQLHVLQEVYELFQLESTEHESAEESEELTDQLFVALSEAAVTGQEGPRTLRLWGEIQGHRILMLLDSGSSHTFLSHQIAKQLVGLSAVHSALIIKVANGGTLKCDTEIKQAVWSVQGCQFQTDIKIIPLVFYDLIIGMDWLEQFSPMKYSGKRTSSSAQSMFASVPEPIQPLLAEFADVYETPTALPPSHACDHSIPLIPGARPVNIRPYRYTPAMKAEIEKQVHEMLNSGVIQPSSSAFCSPVLLVKKKDRTWRFCVDYRHLNTLTVKTQYPVPVIDELLDELGQASWFSSLDLRAGYHQVFLKAGEEFKTAFQTHSGHYEFRVMAFGLSGAPATFQGTMNSTLAPLLRKCVLVFFDDILIYSTSLEEHIGHLRMVLELLQQDQWKVKLSKCSFMQNKLTYLGHVISAHGVVPTNVKELRSFLGLAGYYRKFVKHFDVISQPLNALLKKHTLFVWTADHDLAFKELKHALVSAPVLGLPNFAKPFCIETDASGFGIGAVLLQEGHPLAYISKALSPKHRGLSTYEKEYLAILLAVDQWRCYLQHGEFLIYTDHHSLSHLGEQRLHTPWQQKVFTKLLGLQYRIVYKKGTENRVADALSRRQHEQHQCLAISSSVPVWMDSVMSSYQQDPFAQELLAKLSVDPDSVPDFSLSQGILRRKAKVWIGNNKDLQIKLIEQCHSTPLGGHSGIPVTMRKLKQLFSWKGMKASVHNFVSACLVCQQAKPDRSKLPGLLQPLDIPPSAWHTVSMDFVEGLPCSGSANCILVVVDKFTKYAHFIALLHPFSAQKIAKVFLQSVYKLHGMPVSIISDRDRIFTSNFWRELFKLAGVTLNMSSAYHPQSDGQTERVNQCLETYLRCFVHACPNKWAEWLATAEFWYNASLQSAIGTSPFEALYGHPPRHFGLDASVSIGNMELSQWLQERQLMTDLLQQHLHRAQHRMKKQADKSRMERQFQVGDLVLLKLQPYVQSSLAPRANQKLAFKFFGPFRVLAKCRTVAYTLQLPEHCLIHPTFHVSQLKPVRGVHHPVCSELPSEFSKVQVPEQVLDRRVVQDCDQVLIKWSFMPADMATWENLTALKQRLISREGYCYYLLAAEKAQPVCWGSNVDQVVGINTTCILVERYAVTEQGKE
ncbi:hypothetical protein U9M48_021672 [Paspalum notatum var. saurae]|uniref:Uncharacterized protein n=1 Tax=Paspalum notatum var. saurae TaxID=547442 RepID=A0AAQ3TJI0_PASNO